jgi:hypothetical protein
MNRDMFVIDLLHKFLRISDVLMRHFLNKLIVYDNLLPSSSFNHNLHPNVAKFSNFIVDKCKMKPIRIGCNQIEAYECLQGWMGPNKRLLFQEITTEAVNLATLFSDYPNISDYSAMWKLYWEIDVLLRSNTVYTSITLQNMTRRFLNLFGNTIGYSNITPYIHYFCVHLHEAYEKHGNLNFFSTQGLEKLNDLSTYQYFSSTNNNSKFLKQILEKDFRIATLGNIFE